MRLLREPLLHFLLLGALLFAADAALRGPAEPDDLVIHITTADIDRLRTQWTGQYRRSPSPAELQGLVDAHVREEVLYREGMAMGLDRDDTIVRRRLAQKLEFLIEDVAVARAPTDAELGTFFEARKETYRLPARISFSQVYFSPERRGAKARQDADSVLAGLHAESPAAAAAARGDGFMMGTSYEEQLPADVEAVFGSDFARGLQAIAPGGWVGPIASAYGWHLVRIEERIDTALPTLDEVLDRVRDDWAFEERRRANEEVMTRLAARYAVTIEDGAQDRSMAVSFVDVERQR